MPLEEAHRAHELLESRKTQGKIVLLVEASAQAARAGGS